MELTASLASFGTGSGVLACPPARAMFRGGSICDDGQRGLDDRFRLIRGRLVSAAVPGTDSAAVESLMA
jgi:hypothetical protein